MNAVRFKSVYKILVCRRFCPKTATHNFWRWFCSLQIELARPNYMNRKIETFRGCLVIQNTSKRYASLNRLCKSWIERQWNIWKRSLI